MNHVASVGATARSKETGRYMTLLQIPPEIMSRIVEDLSPHIDIIIGEEGSQPLHVGFSDQEADEEWLELAGKASIRNGSLGYAHFLLPYELRRSLYDGLAVLYTSGDLTMWPTNPKRKVQLQDTWVGALVTYNHTRDQALTQWKKLYEDEKGVHMVIVGPEAPEYREIIECKELKFPPQHGPSKDSKE